MCAGVRSEVTERIRWMCSRVFVLLHVAYLYSREYACGMLYPWTSAPRSRTQVARPDPARHPHVNRIGTVASRQNSTISYGHNASIESRGGGEILRKHTKALTSIAGHVEP